MLGTLKLRGVVCASLLALLTPAFAQQDRRTSSAVPVAQAVPAASAAPSGRPTDDDHIVVPSDLLEIKVFLEPDLDTTLRVSQDGIIGFPLIGNVRVGGLTPQAAARSIRDLLAKDYIVNPHVNVRVMEYAKRRFTVLGEVQKPGSYDMPDRDSVSLLEAIGMSGGYTRIANAASVMVKRRVDNKETVIKLNAKKIASGGGDAGAFEVQSGDVITVGESLF